MNLVLDASVCLKWYLAEAYLEPDSATARELLVRVTDGRIRLCQPSVWRAEVVAVIARKLPATTTLAASELHAFGVEIDDSANLLAHAGTLSTKFDHHLFDTIYHAVAIEHGIDLITADEHYYRKARKLGHIVLLRDWHAPREVREEPASYRVRARKSPARVRRKR